MAEQLACSIQSDFSNTNPPQDELRGRLEELLTEVSALSIRLKQDASGGHNVLRMLRRFGALTVPQMARLDSTSRQNIQTVVNRLERRGCVESTQNPAHKRSELVRLTDRGVAFLEAVSRNEEASKERMLPRISKADLAQASDLLRSIREALGTPSRRNEPGAGTPPQPVEKSARTEGLSSKAKLRKPERVQLEQTSSEDNELPICLL